jgi:membrane protein
MIIIYFVIYYWLPNGKVPASRVFPAAIVAGVATEIVKFIYFLTLPLFSFPETYGPFAVPVTLLFWAYVGSLVMLWGAHFSAQSPPLEQAPTGSRPGTVAQANISW